MQNVRFLDKISNINMAPPYVNIVKCSNVLYLDKEIKVFLLFQTMGNIVYSIIWLVILLLIGFWIAGVCAGLYILLLPFTVCIEPLNVSISIKFTSWSALTTTQYDLVITIGLFTLQPVLGASIAHELHRFQLKNKDLFQLHCTRAGPVVVT